MASYIEIEDYGSYANIDALWAAHPEGGVEGAYCTINDVKYHWDKYDRMWIANPNYGPTPARSLETFDGDVNFQNNVTIAGFLRAKGIKQPCLGLYLTEAALKAKWPKPEVGMWAIVDDELPGIVYLCESDGAWTETTMTAGPDDVDLSSITVNGIKSWVPISSLSQLPSDPTPDQRDKGYLLGTVLYIYVGTGGDIQGGKYKSAQMKGEKGDKGDPGENGVIIEGDPATMIADNLTTDDATKILSAKQGKKLWDTIVGLREAIISICHNLGDYAFLNGKPSIDWTGETIGVYLTLSDVISSNTVSKVDRGDAYTTTLSGANGTNHFMDVAVTMGGVDITSTAYDSSTGIVSVAEVTGAIEITASQYTYLQDNLVFQLDCKERGNTTGHWVDLIGGKDFTLTDVTAADTGMVFNGTTSKGVASGGLDVPYDSCTVEIVGYIHTLPTASSQRQPFLGNTLDGSVAGVSRNTGSGDNIKYFSCSTNGTNVSHQDNRYNVAFVFENNNVAISATKDNVVINGVLVANPREKDGKTVNDYMTGLSSVFAVGYYNVDGTDYYLKGKIMAIRVYSTKLTSAQMIANYEIDKKRFNL